MLSETAQNINVRKTEVFAYVTFVIWILECFANLCIIIVWLFVYGVTSAGTLTTGMVWYYLILPCTYLLNTSENRNRVADNGWSNAIQYAVGMVNQDSNGDITKIYIMSKIRGTVFP